MANQVKYGMVGGSIKAFIGEVHRNAISFDPRAKLAAGCFSTDFDLNVATAEANSVDLSRAYKNFTEMAKKESEREDGIDFVVVTTPNHLHYEVCKTFLEAGIHVVCEKPLCLEVKQAEELVKLSDEKGLLFGVTYTYAGYIMVKVMREIILSGEIGDIISVNAEYAQGWLLDSLSDGSKPGDLPMWRLDPKYVGISNCVGDIGSHIEHTVGYVTGLKIKRLLATANNFGYPLDFNANVILEYENGSNGAYWCTQLAAGTDNDLVVRIYGTKGSLEWKQCTPDYLRYTPKSQAPQILSRGNGYIKENFASGSHIPAGHPEGLHIGFANTYKNFVTSVIKLKAGQKPSEQDLDFPNVKEGMEGVKFIHAVIESAKNNSAWVEL